MTRSTRRPRGVAILWHPPEESYAGGFVAAREFFSRQESFEFTIVDSDSTDIVDSPMTHVLRLNESWSRPHSARFFTVFRIANWIFHAVGAVIVGFGPAFTADFIFVPTSELFCATLPAFVLAKVLRKRLILCNLNVRGPALWRINRQLHRKADAILTISEALASEIRSHVPSVPIGIYPIGTDDQSVSRRVPPRFDAIFVGRHVEEKGIFDLLDVWERCCRTNSRLRLAMVGPCDPAMAEKLSKEIKQRGLAERVELFGAVSEPSKWQLYAEASLCVFPSRVEGWGIVPIEAHLAGIPVVAYDLPAYADHIARSPFATLVPLGDREAFAEAVRARLRDPIDATAAAHWAARFTWESAVRKQEYAVADALTLKPAP